MACRRPIQFKRAICCCAESGCSATVKDLGRPRGFEPPTSRHGSRSVFPRQCQVLYRLSYSHQPISGRIVNRLPLLRVQHTKVRAGENAGPLKDILPPVGGAGVTSDATIHYKDVPAGPLERPGRIELPLLLLPACSNSCFTSRTSGSFGVLPLSSATDSILGVPAFPPNLTCPKVHPLPAEKLGLQNTILKEH